ncbi:MAG: helix-turn-helix domain-containing protein, partial [Solirubrobacteraceae bacterium]
SELDLEFVEQAIMRRVRQGIPLEAILHSFRIGHQVLWAAVLRHADGIPGGPAGAILIVEPSIRYIDTVSTRLAEIYLREQQGALADAHRIRRDLLELLLASGPHAAPTAEAAGVELGDGPHHLLVATLRPSGDQYALRALADEIAATFAPWAALVAIRHDTVTAVVCGDGATAVACAEQLVERRHHAPGPSPRMGISLPAADLVGLGRAHEQAESALRLTSEATPVVALGEMPALDYLLAGADHIARSLVPPAVRTLALSDKVIDRTLVHTLGVYLANGLNVRQTAVALPAHPNTVHGRLRRLAQQTGYDLRDVKQLMRLATELRLGAAR